MATLLAFCNCLEQKIAAKALKHHSLHEKSRYLVRGLRPKPNCAIFMALVDHTDLKTLLNLPLFLCCYLKNKVYARNPLKIAHFVVETFC